MSNENKKDWITTAIMALVGLLTFFFTMTAFVSDRPTRKEVSELIDDKVGTTLQLLREDVQDLKKSNELLIRQISELEGKIQKNGRK